MPAPFGLLSTGFNPMRLEDCRAQLEDDFKAAFGANIRLDDRSVNGQLIGVIAERVSDVWAEAEKAYAAAYLAGASGAALDDLVAFAEIQRRGASLSVATLTLGGTNGTIIPIGSVSKDDDTGILWSHLSTVTIVLGVATVLASPAQTGPVQALTGAVFSIFTPVFGWTSSVVASDASLGRDLETDAALRSRYSQSLRAQGGSAVESLRAAILRLDDITECLIVENKTIAVDADGRPPKSFETVVRAVIDPDVEQTIVDTIWAGEPAGIETYGNQTGSAVDSHGDAQVVKWSRPVALPIYVIVEYAPEAAFIDPLNPISFGVAHAATSAGEILVRDELLEYFSSITLGQDVVPWQIEQNIETPNIRKLLLRVGPSASPTGTDPLDIPRTSIATFDSSRISFVVVA